MTTPGITPPKRLKTLMECYGMVAAAHGPGSSLTFAAFRRALTNDLADLLPKGLDPIDLEGMRVVDTDGHVSEDAFDLAFEQRMLLRTLRKLDDSAGMVSDQDLQSQIEQESVYELLSKPGDQIKYEQARADLIRTPAGPVATLSELMLPTKVADMYNDIPYEAIYEGWWFACPICGWPMRIFLRENARILTGSVRCWHQPHADMGASYIFRPTGAGAPVLAPALPYERPPGRESVLYPVIEPSPQAVPVAGCKALARGVWRYTTIPGIPELSLRDKLLERGISVQLWPVLDSYDLKVDINTHNGPKTFKVDVKDFTSATMLGNLVHAQEGDKGGAQWLVVPDYRDKQVPLLSGVCEQYGMRVATASEFGEMVCQMAGVKWQ